MAQGAAIMGELVDEIRGHAIHEVDGEWRYVDTGEPTVGNHRPCGHCGLADTPEGHDGCLGTLPGVLNACCGHGDPSRAYVQIPGAVIDGSSAVALIDVLRARTQEVQDVCRIYEYDGAFRCLTHDRMWGAITDPDEPCDGWEDER